MEITVISVQGLKTTTSSPSLFSHHHRLRPFITLTTTPPSSNGEKPLHVYKTRVKDDEGAVDPTWGDKFNIPTDASSFFNYSSCIYLHVYTKRLVVDPALLGWCQIPATDITDAFLPAGVLRYLSYRLRNRDGSRGHGVVNVGVKLEDSGFPALKIGWPDMGLGRTVMGIPVQNYNMGKLYAAS